MKKKSNNRNITESFLFWSHRRIVAFGENRYPGLKKGVLRALRSEKKDKSSDKLDNLLEKMD